MNGDPLHMVTVGYEVQPDARRGMADVLSIPWRLPRATMCAYLAMNIALRLVAGPLS